MVSHSHLSAGNSDSSNSRNLFAEYGVSNPNSPSDHAQEVRSQDDMVESLANPLAVALSSDDSTSLDHIQEDNLGPSLDANAHDIFKAAFYFTRKDREEAVHERKMNRDLIDFITAHGLSLKDVNDFVLHVKISKPSNALARESDLQESLGVADSSPSRSGRAPNVFDKSPHPREDPVNPLSASGAYHNDSVKEPEGFPPLMPLNFCKGQEMEEGEILPHLPSDNVANNAYIPLKSAAASSHNPLKSWSSVVAQGDHQPSFNLEYFPPSPPSSEDKPIIIKPPPEVLKQGNSLWQACLIGGFLHSRLPFKVVADNAHKMWDKYGFDLLCSICKSF